MDDRVPERSDSHASSSHEPSSEPTSTSGVDLGKHSVYTHFPKDRNCEICQRTKITRGLCAEDVLAESYLMQKILVIRSQQITNFSVKVVNLETIIDMHSFVQDLVISVQKQKLLKKHKGACKSSWSRIGNLKSFTLWQFLGIWQSLWRSFLESLYVDTTQIGNKCDCWKTWNALPICETSQICCLMGRRPMKDVLGNHLKDRLFRLVHWLNITMSLRKTSQESINLERNSYLVCSLDTLCTRREFGRVT